MKTLNIPLFLSLLVFNLGAFAQEHIQRGLATINRNSLEAQLAFLSSDWFEGREATTKGAYMAADYLASLYQSNGLSPFTDNSYFQKVPLLVAHAPHKATIALKTNELETKYAFPEHFRAERIHASFALEAAPVWAGYGINSGQLKEVNTGRSKGKIMIRLTGLPEATEGSKLQQLLSQQTEQELHTIKKQLLEQSEAVAILEYDVNDPNLEASIAKTPTYEAAAEQVLNKRSSGIYQKSLFLTDEPRKGPYQFKVSKAIMESLIPNFEQFLNNYLADLQNLSINSKVPFSASSLKLEAEAHVELKQCNNVIAMIEGSEKPEEVIVVGAHYDHLGSYNGYIWNGADDNGSGAIGVAAIAKAFMATGVQPKRTVIFANWTAEERGLFGSRYFVKHFKDIDKIKYYHNYDMIGRSYNYEQPDSAVSLLYTKEWAQAETLCKQYNKEYQLGLKINFSAWDNPTSGSDNAPFAKKGIPIMWFHTGGHESYHMPSDHVDRIDWQKLEAIVKTSFLTLWNLANE
ncbi:M20/M25/M40 family metallo-hydrolase [Carboxylicivirga mesophila]|uniref:M20/M25/M40 family metallo-hydrolase n=1 Tax=Carboxylicivirga mesophila TaxID=1166478 RepID=A0ABS5KB56_9BACT|nr:M20/M25/M40 family metallo-hydrolase [Carboxylicivirga mesophila]MBS2211578.1 M20/M25/M40 family metallo-hydrolase [Carboxylicivirga mesophila]